MPALALLAACGGSETGGSSFAQLSSSGINLVQKYGDADPTAPAAMPTGSATYNGVAAYSTDYSMPENIVNYADTLSKVQLNANFNSSTLSGKAYDFVTNEPGYTIAGELQVNGIINSNTFTAGIGGTLMETYQGVSVPVGWTGNIAGGFVGTNAQGLVGLGTAVSTGIYGGVTANTVFGAER